MIGQLFGWIMEIWYAILFLVISAFYQQDALREIAPLIKDFEFVLVPLVEVYTSAPITRFRTQGKKVE